MDFAEWSTTAASNLDVDGIDIDEGMSPAGVNNAMRAIMANLAAYRDLLGGLKVTGGSSNAYTLTSGLTTTAYQQGLLFAFEANHTNTGTSTLTLDGIGGGAKTFKRTDGGNLVAGDIVAGSIYLAAYETTAGVVFLLNPSLDADLLAIAALAPSNDDILQRKAGVWTNRTLAQLNADLLSSAYLREKLTGNRTYYVRTDGSDSNTGLVDSAGGAFLTLQKAYDVIVGTLDLGGFDVTVDVGDGTYTGGLATSEPWTGGGSVTFLGNTGTPANVIVSPAGSAIFNTATLPGPLTFSGMRVSSSGAYGIVNDGIGSLILDKVDTGACAFVKIFAAKTGATIKIIGNYTDIGNSIRHYDAQHGGFVQANSITVTESGTPAYSGSYAYATDRGGVEAVSVTFSGSATGPRYIGQLNAVFSVGGAASTYFPGDAVGSVTSGAVYG